MQLRIKKDGQARGKIKLVQDSNKQWVAYTESSKVYKHLHGLSEYDVQTWLAQRGFTYKVDYRG